MSKKVELAMDCPRCGKAFTASLYRTIWVENSENLELIMADKINVVHCPACGLSERQPFPFLATNAGKRVAVWYEPIADRNIDSDLALYRKHYGDDYFLAKAERIKNWAEFKRRLIELNEGPDAKPSVEELTRLRVGMKSTYANTTELRQEKRSSGLIASLKTWAGNFRKKRSPIAPALPISADRMRLEGKSTTPVNPITKLERAVSTWDREQARIALAVFASTVFKDRAPLESLFGRGAKVETATRRLTVSHLKTLYSIMTEIVPDDRNGHTAED